MLQQNHLSPARRIVDAVVVTFDEYSTVFVVAAGADAASLPAVIV